MTGALNFSLAYNRITIIPTGLGASSELTADGISYPARQAFDGDANTCWQEAAAGKGAGECLYVEFGAPVDISLFSIRPGYACSSGSFTRNCRPKTLRVTLRGEGFSVDYRLSLTDENRMFYFALPYTEIITCYAPTITVEEVYPGTDYEDLAISDFGFYSMQLDF